MICIREKALFLIFLIVISSFTIINIPDVGAQQQVCCEKTKSGEFCQYTDVSQCDPSGLNTPATCEAASFCKLGCCFDSSTGECFKQSSRSECQLKDGVWEESPTCEIQQCNIGCCQINNQAFISTLVKCKQVTSQYPNVQTTFDSSIQDEFSCVNSVRSGELGCCVKAEGECSFTTRTECGLESSRGEVGQNESKQIAGAFYAGTLCSNDKLKCNAAKQQKLGCYNEDVYWFDSCGNPENVFLGVTDEAKQRSYNRGLALEESGCVAKPGDTNCGNCDYTQGTLCGEKDGEFFCRDLNCKETTKNDKSPDATGRAKKLGESWCIYDGPVGFGRDYVGSRHFKASCINGEEVVEPCRDFREEYCTQSYSQGTATTEIGSLYRLLTENVPQLVGASSPLSRLFGQGSGYSEAACRENRVDSCAQCNEFSSTNDAIACCNERAYRDCYFLPAGVTKKGGTCVPLVPPGLRFWSDETSILNKQTETKDKEQSKNKKQSKSRDAPSAPGDDVCSKANIECTVGFTRSGWDHILGKSKWECTSNCQCLKEETFAAAHSVCRSLGDCGSYFNWQGVFSEGGVDVKVNGPKGELAVPDRLREKVKARIRDDLLRDALAKPSKEGAKPEKPGFGEFFKRTAVPGILILTSGILAAPTPLTFFGGLIYGPHFLIVQTANLFTSAFNTFGTGTGSASLVNSMFSGVEFAPKAAGEGAKQLTRTTGGTTVTSAGYIWGTVQVIAWAWLIYEAVDVFASDTMTTTGTFLCKSWEAPDGGKDCEKCNGGNLPCSLYRCKALGKACSIVNEGSKNELCVSLLPGDATSPRISAHKEKMKDLKIEEQALRGFTVSERILPFTPVKLALETDEPAQCKFSTTPSVKYDEMPFDFGSPSFAFEHNLTFSLPSEFTGEQALKLTNGGQYAIYVRCKDANGNDNDRDYYIKFGVQRGPDLTIPHIIDASIGSGALIAALIDRVNMSIFVDEPAQCRWDKRDIDYEVMQHNLRCAQSGSDISRSGYTCGVELPIEKPDISMKSGNETVTKENIFYFRCKDMAGNKNIQSLRFTLFSTISLNITKKEPSGLLRTGTGIELKVETAQGAENGIALCGYSLQNVPLSNMPEFGSTLASVHTQKLPPQAEGDYTFYIVCIDKAGNLATDTIKFKVERDTIAPQLVSVSKDTQLGILTIKIDEPAQCEYADAEFAFGRGTKTASTDNIVHQASLGNALYVVKCRDISESHNEAIFRIVP